MFNIQNINEVYKCFVADILANGNDVYKDDNHHLHEILGNHYYIQDPLNLKYMAKYKNITSTMMLDMIKNGDFDIQGCPIKSDALYEYVKSFNDSSDQGFVYSYPNRILEHFGINQFDVMKKRILNATGSNRAVAVTYDPSLDADRKDIPCLQFLQCIVRNNKLTIHCVFRSNDIFGAFYSNMYFITYIGIKMVEEVNNLIVGAPITFDGIHYYSTSAHIYHNDLNSAMNLIAGR